jgi:hypothetical protein
MNESQNILNNYRSFTYNFTLAGLSKTEVNDPSTYRDSSLNFVILKSGGTGGKNLSGGGSTNSLVNSFNSSGSSGKYDMFINDVRINNIMAFTKENNNSLATGIAFTVYEPYGVNGFLEALNVAAVASGYESYMSASFVLKMEFIGYNDTESTPNPEIVDAKKATRYYTFIFTRIDLDITEKGTQYTCEGVPWHEKGFGNANRLKLPINISGKKVKDILKNLMDGVNSQLTDSAKQSRASGSTTSDIYEVQFRKWDPSQGFIKDDNSPIADSDVSELDMGVSKIYKFPDNAEAAAKGEKVPLTSLSSAVQFQENTNISDCITSIIRDSTFSKKILKNVETLGNGALDSQGYFDYFMVNMIVENQDKIDKANAKFFKKFIYVIHPFKVHFTMIPANARTKIDVKKLQNRLLRKYNYIYTGKNTDIKSFKLRYNTTFFEAASFNQGIDDQVPSGIGPTNSTDRVLKDQSYESGGNPIPEMSSDPEFNRFQTDNLPSGGQPRADPYKTMASAMHQSIINPKGSMLTGEIEILGDPVFLVTNGLSNYYAKPVSSGNVIETQDGEANHLYSDCLISIDFRNPTDIKPLSEGGLMDFRFEKPKFAGIYKVALVTSTFKDGIFAQKLEIIRMPGQIDTPTPAPTSIATTEEISDSNSLGTPDTSRAAPVKDSRASTDAIYKLVGKIGGSVESIPAAGRLSSGLSLLSNASKLAGASTISGALGSAADVLTENSSNSSGIKITAGVVATNLVKAGLQAGLAASPLGSALAVADVGSKTLELLTNLGKKFPANFKLSDAPGLSLATIPVDKFKNLPATPVFRIAPQPEPDKVFLSTLDSKGLAESFGVSDPSKIPNGLGKTLSSLKNKIGSEISGLSANKVFSISPGNSSAVTDALTKSVSNAFGSKSS